MPKIIMVDGVSLEMTDTAAQVVQRALDTAQEKIDEFKKNSEKTAEELAAEKKKNGDSIAVIATKDAEIITLKVQVKDAQISPQKLDVMVRDRVAVITKAKTILGDKLIVDGKTDGEIRRQVVTSNVGVISKDWNDDQVVASFDTIQAAPPASGQGVDRMANGFATVPQQTSMNDAEKAYDEYVKDIGNAWQKKATA